jgi:acyl-coenzyme A thioesterase PaaI-like protein
MKNKYRVLRKQQNSKMCLVCGLSNKMGLHTSFYELENGELMAIFTPREEHQSYPNRLHGGISTAILDETIGRAIMIKDDHNYWGVTVDFSIKFKQPIPLNEELRIIGRITKDKSRLFEGTGEILLQDGTVAALGAGKYIKQPLSKIADFNEEEQNWKINHLPNDPETFEL